MIFNPLAVCSKVEIKELMLCQSLAEGPAARLGEGKNLPFPFWRKGCSKGKQNVGLQKQRRALLTWADPQGLHSPAINLPCPSCHSCSLGTATGFASHLLHVYGSLWVLKLAKEKNPPLVCSVRKATLSKVESLHRHETISEAFFSLNLELGVRNNAEFLLF